MWNNTGIEEDIRQSSDAVCICLDNNTMPKRCRNGYDYKGSVIERVVHWHHSLCPRFKLSAMLFVFNFEVEVLVIFMLLGRNIRYCQTHNVVWVLK